MILHTYLNYGGNCEQAFRFYEQHLGGKITMMMKHGEQPDASGVSPDWKNAILHARIHLGETVLMGADIPPDRFQPMRTLIFPSALAAQQRRSGFMPCFPMAARSSCPCRRLFLPSVSGCCGISSARPG